VSDPSLRPTSPYLLIAPLLAVLVVSAACKPTVQLAAPEEPITINLNIKLDADVRLHIEEKAKEDVGTKPIF
jgi:hypothetical protein